MLDDVGLFSSDLESSEKRAAVKGHLWDRKPRFSKGLSPNLTNPL